MRLVQAVPKKTPDVVWRYFSLGPRLRITPRGRLTELIDQLSVIKSDSLEVHCDFKTKTNLLITRLSPHTSPLPQLIMTLWSLLLRHSSKVFWQMASFSLDTRTHSESCVCSIILLTRNLMEPSGQSDLSVGQLDIVPHPNDWWARARSRKK